MDALKSDYLFVYSSLMMGFKNPEYSYIRNYFSFVSEAKVKGTLSDMGDMPVATPASGDHFIKGELYKIKNEDDFSFAMGQLDDYEGVRPEAGEERLYKRALTMVYLDNDRTESAWIYWYQGDVAGKPVIASGDVREYVQSKAQ